jgi:putative oxidoreductase
MTSSLDSSHLDSATSSPTATDRPGLVQRLRRRGLALTQRLSFLAPVLLRVTLGAVFIGTGWGKLQSLDDVTRFFTELAIPFPGVNARVVAATEFFGGILILVGLGTRLVALPMTFTMVVAILTAKRAEIDGIATLFGFEEWSYLVMFLALVLIGAGPLSLDQLIAGRPDAARHTTATLRGELRV